VDEMSSNTDCGLLMTSYAYAAQIGISESGMITKQVSESNQTRGHRFRD
jgi:hypothetical protein